jgi:hypothetical protein
MEHGTGTRRHNAGSQNDGVQRQYGGEGSTREKSKPRNYRGIHEIESGEASDNKKYKTSEEKIDSNVARCDGKCTPQDRHEGVFGFVCTRCNYDDLGSLTEY